MNIRYDKCWVQVDDHCKYYVYAYYDEKGIPFYIGKGKGFRVNSHMKPSLRKHHSYKNHKINKLLRNQGYVRREIIAYLDCEKEAYNLEEFLISQYGVASQGGLLTNVTLSYNDVPALLHSKEVRLQTARQQTKYTEREALEMIELYQHGIYNQKELAKIYNISSSAVGSMLCGNTVAYKHLNTNHKKRSLNRYEEFDVLAIVLAWQNLTPLKQLQQDFNISKTHLYRLIKNYLAVDVLCRVGDGTSTDPTNIDNADSNLENKA